MFKKILIANRGEIACRIIHTARKMGIRVEHGKAIAKVKGGKRVTGVVICAQAGSGGVLEEIACDAVAMSGGWSPVVHLYSHCGGKLNWDDQAAMFRPDLNRRPTDQNGEGFVTPAGSANGELAYLRFWPMLQRAPKRRSKLWATKRQAPVCQRQVNRAKTRLRPCG